jgi:rhamnosyltransferase
LGEPLAALSIGSNRRCFDFAYFNSNAEAIRYMRATTAELAEQCGWNGNPDDVAVIIPTLNAGAYLDEMIPALEAQALPPSSILVIDSGSRDETVERFRAFGAEVVGLGERPFNHGGTRRYGTELRPRARFFILQTHDAVPAGPDAFVNLLRAFDDPCTGMAYGRQLPRRQARAIERHARLFNYPPTSAVRSYSDRVGLGVKTIFCSDSFAAYRADALHDVGGFPEDAYFAEDQVLAAQILRKGYQLAYCADAAVTHSHGYTLVEDFRRYFDVGVWHGRDRSLIEEFGRAEGEGMRFLRSELAYLLRKTPLSLPSALVRTLAKYAGYKLGQREEWFSARQKTKLAMQSFYWAQQVARERVR